MTNYFVSSADGDDTDDGTTMDDGSGGGVGAWATLDHALELGGLAAGDIVWVRRTHSEVPVSDINIQYVGTAKDLIRVIGWPRAADATADGASFTNGSTTVDLVTTLSIDREQHLGRYITAPDGNTYMITLVTDANTFTIDREYAGATVTLGAGAFTVQADEDWVDDMGTEYGFDDSGWTIKETAWDADPDDLAEIDFNEGVVQLKANADDGWHKFNNLDLKNSGDSIGLVALIASCRPLYFEGCLFSTTTDDSLLDVSGAVVRCKRCVFDGTGVAIQLLIMRGGMCFLTDCALYGGAEYGFFILRVPSRIIMDNVNVGVEAANGVADIRSLDGAGAMFLGRDVVFGQQVALFDNSDVPMYDLSIENFGKVLGANATYNALGTVIKLDVVAGSGDPYKRSSGFDSVIEILYNEAFTKEPDSFQVPLVFTHEFEATTDIRRYRYYVQSEKAVLASELWIEVEYVSAYDDATEYVIRKVTSDEAITIRGGVSDWSQYIEVEDIEPAVGSTVRIKCYCNFYDATDKIYIDPLCEVTT